MKWNKIGISILFIGLINLYNITKGGIIISLASNIIDIERIGVIKLIIITIIISIIFTFQKITIKEYEILIGLGLIGLYLIGIGKEWIIIYIGLEIYNITTYNLITLRNRERIRRISIIYLIITSLCSGLILFSISQLYSNYNFINLDWIDYFNYQGIYRDLIIIAIIIKLGLVPFTSWLIRLYSNLDLNILAYLLTIPKFILFFLIVKIFPSSYLNSLILILSLFTLLVGAIGGLFHKNFHSLLAYSSIFNIGFLLSAYSILTLNDNIINLWPFYQYFIIYILNTIALIAIFLLFNPNIYLFKKFNNSYFISYLILVLSFIGIPPLGGFFSKFYLLFIYFSPFTLTLNTLSLSLLLYIILILSSFISSFIYLKFLFSPSLSTGEGGYFSNSLFFSPLKTLSFNGSDSKVEGISFSLVILSLYPFFIPFLAPFFL